MSRITSVFKAGHKALIAYITAGYPDIESTVKIAAVLDKAGCDIIELGIPFSDPLADGATIQKASHHALMQGVTPRICLEAAATIRKKINAPLVFMTYYNPVLNHGPEAFCQSCVKAGVDGLIIPDLPPEEGTELEEITRKHDIDLIYLLAPTSTEKRITEITARSRGFIYLVSLTGVTGARKVLSPEIGTFIARVRKKTKKPLCVGFGISRTEHAVRAASFADGVIIGSRLIELIEEDSTLDSLKSFISSLRNSLDTMKNTGRY